MSALFDSKYTKPIPKYYPYSSVIVDPTVDPSGTALPTSVPTAGSRSSGTPSWIGPLLGVVLGLLVFGAVLAGLLLWRRRRRGGGRGRGSNASTTGPNRYHHILAWRRATASAKAPTVTTTEPTSSLSAGTTALNSTGDLSYKALDAASQEAPEAQESGGVPIYELDGASFLLSLSLSLSLSLPPPRLPAFWPLEP